MIQLIIKANICLSWNINQFFRELDIVFIFYRDEDEINLYSQFYELKNLGTDYK